MTLGEGSAFALPTDNDDILAQALALAGAGIPVFPVHGLREAGGCECPDPGCKAIGKHPTVKGWGDLATTDVGRIEQWFKNTRHNLGIPTGQRSGLVVIDVDPRNGGDDTLDTWESWNAPDLPWTLRCRTGSGGLHIFLRVPEGVKIGMKQAVLPGIDIKGEGGLVVGAPSRHKSGDRYRWIDPATEVKFAEGEVLTWLLTVRGNTSHQVGGGSGATPVGYSYESALASGCPAGARDTFFNDLAFRCKAHRGLSQAQALEVVRHHWERAESTDDDSFDWRHAEFKVLRMYSDDNVPLATNQATPEQLAIAARWTGNLASGVQEPAVAGTGEVAESTAGVGSSGQAGGGGNVGGGSWPLVEGEPPAFETELTQTGNAHRFVRIFNGAMLFVEDLGWHAWDGSRWAGGANALALERTQAVLQTLRHEQQLEGDTPQGTRIQRWYDTSSGERARSSMLKLAEVDSRMRVKLDDMNRDPWSLVVQNGTLDLKTQTLRASRPEDRNTRCAAVTYDPAARCPQWEAHIERVTRRKDGTPDPALAAYVRRWVGYTLTGSVQAEKFFFGFGEGANGKNVLIETVLGMLGDYGHTAGAKIFSDKEHDTVIADLAGRRMVFIDETVKGRVNDGRLKMLTGSTRVTARKIAKDSITFDATFKLWLAGNHKPRVDDTTEGFWRRLELVPFDTIIPKNERVTDYGKVLEAEWSGILNWALAGLKDYLKLEGLGQPDRVETAVGEYREQENVFGQFVEDLFEVESEDREWIPSTVLMKLITKWYEQHGVRQVPSVISLGKGELQRAGFETDGKKRRVVVWPNPKSTPERGWTGPKLREPLFDGKQWSLMGVYQQETGGTAGGTAEIVL